MWVVIMYVCFVNGSCAFIDSPPMYLESECEYVLAEANKMADADPNVYVYDSKCIQVKTMEVGEVR